MRARSEEHTSELQSHDNLVCRLLLEKKKNNTSGHKTNTLWLPQSRATSPAPSPWWRRLAVDACLTARGRGSALECSFFFFNDPATPEIYPLSLPDALPINDTATTEIYPLSLHDVFRSRWSPYHFHDPMHSRSRVPPTSAPPPLAQHQC